MSNEDDLAIYEAQKRRIDALEAALAEERAKRDSIPEVRRVRGRIGAEISWANTEDRPARTRPARTAFEQKFLDAAGGDPVRAAHLKKAHFARLALKSAKVRRAKKADREQGDGR